MRILIFKYTLTFLLVILLGGLFYTQIVQGVYFADLSENNRIRLQTVPAPRGKILDTNGKILAGNRPSYNVTLTPRDFDKAYSSWLEQLLKLDTGSVLKKVTDKRINPFVPILLQQDVAKEVVFQIQESKPNLTGVAITVQGRRTYPYADKVAHLTGYIGKVSREEYKQGDGKFLYNDTIGRMGIESLFDDVLRGENGGRQVEVNARGEVIRVLSEKPPTPGENTTLSIDMDLQEIVWEVVSDYPNSLALGILDLKTFEMVAMISRPSYDPNIFVTGGKTKERLDLLRDKNHPLLDRLVGVGYPPGSVFKLIVAMAGLDTGKIHEHSTYECSGTFRLGGAKHVFHCWNKYGHGALDLIEAITRSCNVYFYNLGRKLGVESIARMARIFGFHEKPGVELPRVFAGLVPDDAWKRRRIGEKWYQGETISYAIGQGYLLVSPLQVLRATAGIALDGNLPTLSILEGQGGKSQKMALSQDDINQVKEGMRRVVETDAGTGKYARISFAKIGAKTGTAQNPHGKSHAWFTGYFPFDSPRYALVCLIEKGGAGGFVAGTLTREILTAWQQQEGTFSG
jgi:penicillin-binding protein 2